MNQIKQHLSPNTELPNNRILFDTEISQDNPVEEKTGNDFAPWFRKKTYKQNADNQNQRQTHGFLSKLNLPSKLPKMANTAGIKQEEGDRALSWLKKNLKNKINHQGVLKLEDDHQYSPRFKFAGNPNSVYRKKVMKFYHKPKSIDLSLEEGFPDNNLKTSHNSYFSPNSVTERIKNKRQISLSSSKKDRKTIDYILPQSRESVRYNILETRKKFYQTLELKITRDGSEENRRKKLSLLTQSPPSKPPKPHATEAQKISQERKKISSRMSNHNEGFACEGKKITKNEVQNHRQKIRTRLLNRKKEDHQKIFLS